MPAKPGETAEIRESYGIRATCDMEVVFFLRQMVKLLQMMAILMGGSMILMEVLMGQT